MRHLLGGEQVRQVPAQVTAQRFETQRDVVLNERRQNYENRPYGLAGIALSAAMFPPDHPYHWPTIGSADDLRAAMGDAAVRGARAIEYVGAGTIEMLLNEDNSFYFMEMNTRIQVEHPVTEMCTGFDLVKEQIRAAAGLPLSLPNVEIQLRGHAIECRINAEDPARNFAPSPGTISTFHLPGGPGVRVDTHVYAGYKVPQYYDSLLGKLIVHGATREEAIGRMKRALMETVVEGVHTTIPFLLQVMDNPEFIAGEVDTKSLERWMAAEKA